ncbi:phosphate ABC transporter permease PstA [Glycomyces xiaoerkulensis]|uniref:phosphate ABC transporter permease PstA n=1 Tax=Glycomyces xiaoerkulensis TaxID=2038139 RepID=UPI000C2646AF|nr:phosphate ABC transporter permease PstA [Glycomyces xiaoerkulensis]
MKSPNLAASGAAAATERGLLSNGRGKTVGTLFASLLFFGLSVAMLGLAWLLVWSFLRAQGRLSWDLFTNPPSTLDIESAGFRPAILGTLMVMAFVFVVIVPLGVGAAIYLEEYADRNRWYNRFIELNIQNLAGVPAVVFGILGLAFIARGPFGLGFIPLTASLTLALLVLPTVILATREAIRAVPDSIRQGSLALGATKWQTISRQVLPVSIPGITTGVILAVSRAIGEAAPLLLVGATTFVVFDPELFNSGYTVLPVQIYQYATRAQPEFHDLAAAGVVIMLIVLLTMNGFAIWLRNHFDKKRVG